MCNIDIAFISDDGYALPTGVAISSIYNHRNPKLTYHIHVIASGIGEDNLVRLRALSADNFAVDIIDADTIASYEEFGRMTYAQHVSPAALYKFNLPEVFPAIDKLLYLDGDILVRDSLEELFATDIDDCLAAVVKDVGAESFPSHYNHRLGINHKGYFNSGVMLLNLKRMRDEQISSALINYKLYGKNDFMDQDAFNVVFAERVKYLSFLYNMGMSCWRSNSNEYLSSYYEIDSPSVEWLYTNAKILHLSAREKPWVYNNVYGSEEWLAEFVRSSFLGVWLHRISNERGLSVIENGCDYKSICYSMKIMGASHAPRVSVVIPVYNSARTLAETIESLICQTLTDAEFIFVDDGSEDSSVEVVLHYARLDSRIKLLRQENSYAGVARNNGITAAVGKYVTFLDSDDCMLPTALMDFLLRAEETGADIVISSAYHYANDINDRREADWCLRRGFITMENGISRRTMPKTLFQISAGAPWAKLFSRELLLNPELRFPALPRAEDFYFTYLAFALAKNIAVLDKHTVLYHNDSESGSLENAKDKYPTAQLAVREMLFEKLVELGLFDELKQTFVTNTVNSYYYHLRTFKTGEAFKLVFDHFREVAVVKYGIDMSDADYFHVPLEYRYMKAVCDASSSDDFIYRLYMEEKTRASRRMTITHGGGASDEASEIRKSWSYKIGRFITWLPRKVRGFFRCVKEHGLRYTLNLMSKKISSAFKKKK